MLRALVRVDCSSRMDDRIASKMSETGVAERAEGTGMSGIDAGSNFENLEFSKFSHQKSRFSRFWVLDGPGGSDRPLKHSLYSDSPGHLIGPGHGPLAPDGS